MSGMAQSNMAGWKSTWIYSDRSAGGIISTAGQCVINWTVILFYFILFNIMPNIVINNVFVCIWLWACHLVWAKCFFLFFKLMQSANNVLYIYFISEIKSYSFIYLFIVFISIYNIILPRIIPKICIHWNLTNQTTCWITKNCPD